MFLLAIRFVGTRFRIIIAIRARVITTAAIVTIAEMDQAAIATMIGTIDADIPGTGVA